MHTEPIETNRLPPLASRLQRAFVCCLTALGFAACTTSASTDQIESATLHLELEQCTGRVTNQATAVVISNGLVVSVAHPFHQTKSFELQDSDGQVLKSTLVHLDFARDLAVLQLVPDSETSEPRSGLLFAEPDEELDVRYVTFADGNPDVGPTIVDASILRYTRLTLDGVGDRAGIELQAPIATGDSGGPVLNTDGQILGLIFATARGSDTGWAIASEEVIAAVDHAKEAGLKPVPLLCSD